MTIPKPGDGYDPHTAAARATYWYDATASTRTHMQTATARVEGDASRMPNPPPWLVNLDLTPWLGRRAERVAQLRRR